MNNVLSGLLCVVIGLAGIIYGIKNLKEISQLERLRERRDVKEPSDDRPD